MITEDERDILLHGFGVLRLGEECGWEDHILPRMSLRKRQHGSVNTALISWALQLSLA